jgi:hypothetical protein
VTSFPPRAHLAVLSTDEGHVIAAYNPLLLVCFTRPPREAELDLLKRQAQVGVAAGIRGGFLYVVARPTMSGGVDPRVRKTFEDMARAYGGRSGASAVVVLTEGFGGAMVRGVLAGLALLMTQRKVLQVFRVTEEAARWLANAHGLDEADLLRAYRQATAHLRMPGDST